MYTSWRTSSDNSNEDDAEDMALMDMEGPESDTDKREVYFLGLKNKLKCFFKEKIIFLCFNSHR